MPLKPSQILALLQAKRSDFQAFDRTAFQVLHQYRSALSTLSGESPEAIAQRISQQNREQIGAEPLEALGSFPSWVIPSNLTWQNREQSLEWVRDRLMGIPTFAVDGSQIYPSKDFSIPIALIQVGWFENFHLPNGAYHKDIALDILTPAQLRAVPNSESLERLVHQRRFEIEIRRLIQYMHENQAEEIDRNTENASLSGNITFPYRAGLVFYDGSLIATFAEVFEQTTRQFYTHSLRQLLQTSDRCRVPLVAYIDTSYARDLTTLLRLLFNLPEASTIHDAALLNPLMQWGDRTPVFRCRRPGILQDYQDQSDQIMFTYLKAHDGYPVRLEMPVWIYEAGILERVMDWIRGEIIVGGGYPYAIETADQVAVLQESDRQLFYRMLQEWADREQLHLRLSRKMVSKVRRRL